MDCIASLQNGADLLWIETEKPHIEQIAGMVDRIREVVPNAKLAYNNSPSFNWTLNFRQQVFDSWQAEGKDVSAYDRAKPVSYTHLDVYKRQAQQFVQHQLPRMPVEPAQPVGHDIGRQDADAELVTCAQPLRNRAIKVAARKAQFIRQFLGAGVEVGEMVAPFLDLSLIHI